MSLKFGWQAKLYFLSTGTRATWGAAGTNGVHTGTAGTNLTEISNVKDLELSLEAGESDVTTRANGGFEATAPGLFKGSIDIPQIWDLSDAGVLALQAAYLNRTTIALAMLDGDKATSGAEGFWADWAVLKLTKMEQMGDAQMVKWTVKPGYSAVAPEFVKVT